MCKHVKHLEMQANIQKWGNSLAIRIPKILTEETGVSEGSSVEMTLENGKIILKPLHTNKYSLNDLLKKVNKNNLHDEINTNEPLGNEIW